jgi:hypothetical protein
MALNAHLPPDKLPATRHWLPGWLIGGAAVLVVGGLAWLFAHPVNAPERPVAAAIQDTGGFPPSMDGSAYRASPQPAAPSRPALQAGQAHSSGGVTATDDRLQKVQLALSGGTPEQALDAARTLAACAGADSSVDALFTGRDQKQTPQMLQAPQGMGVPTEKVINYAQKHQRQCQVFDAAMLARRGELLERAYEGGAEGASLDYLRWLSRNGRSEIDPALISKLQGESRQAAEAGDPTTLMAYAFAFDPSELGASPTQRQAYKDAWLRIQGEQPSGSKLVTFLNTSIDGIERMLGTAPLNAQQQAEADALSQQVFESYQHRGKHG